MNRILVAEDNPVTCELLREILESRGYEVIEARDGKEALAKIEECRPDLVLLDIQMPILDGSTVLQKIRRDYRFANLRVVALTAFAMRGDREKILGSGFDSYVTKPIEISALTTEINRLLK